MSLVDPNLIGVGARIPARSAMNRVGPGETQPGNAARRFNPTKYRTPEQLLGRRGVACGHVWGLVEGEEKHRPLFTYTNNMNTHGFQANVVITGATACATAAAFKAPHRHRLLAPPRHKRHRYSQFFSDALADGFRYQLSGTNFVESYAKLKGFSKQFPLHPFFFSPARIRPRAHFFGHRDGSTKTAPQRSSRETVPLWGGP